MEFVGKLVGLENILSQIKCVWDAKIIVQFVLMVKLARSVQLALLC